MGWGGGVGAGEGQESACLLAVDHHFMAETGGITETGSDTGGHALQGEGNHGATPPQHITPCSTATPFLNLLT